MADPQTVWVYATERGQLPNGMWANPGYGPFEVEASKVSKRWMKPAPDAEQKALSKAKAEAAKAKAEAEGDPQAIIAQLTEQVAALTSQVANSREALALANAQKGALEAELKSGADALKAAKDEIANLKASPPTPAKASK